MVPLDSDGLPARAAFGRDGPLFECVNLPVPGGDGEDHGAPCP